MSEHYTAYLYSPLGWLKILSEENAISAISFVEKQDEPSAHRPEILQKCINQLDEYFSGKRKTFELELAPAGSAFQHRIWKLVTQIPYGNTCSYLEIATQSGSSKNTRAVGLANGKNPIPIIVPCHRVIGSNGKLTGYAGGLERKRWLLLHEQEYSSHPGTLF